MEWSTYLGGFFAQFGDYLPLVKFGVTLGLCLGFVSHLVGYGVSALCSLLKHM